MADNITIRATDPHGLYADHPCEVTVESTQVAVTAEMTADTKVTWGSFPSQLLGYQAVRVLATHQTSRATEFSIRVNQNCTVYYAHDDANGERPDFLATEWVDSGLYVTPSDGVQRKLFSRAFTANVTYSYVWGHTNWKKRLSYLIGGFLIPSGVIVTVTPEWYDVVSTSNYVAPNSDKFMWNNEPLLTGVGTTKSASPSNLQTVVNGAVAGDKIVLANGTYAGVITVTNRNGTKQNPIYIVAATPGGVVSGGAGLFFSFVGSSYIMLAGIKFTGNYTAANPGPTIFMDQNCKWIRASNCRLDAYNNATDNTALCPGVQIEGDYCRADHISIYRKTNNGQPFRVTPVNLTVWPRFIRIDHCDTSFYMPVVDAANGDGAQLGQNANHGCDIMCLYDHNNHNYSGRQEDGTKSVATVGELLSFKSANVHAWGNIFKNSHGNVTMRKTDSCLLVGNKFLSTDTYEQGSNFRVLSNIGDDNTATSPTTPGQHILAANYFDGLKVPSAYYAPLFFPWGDDGHRAAAQCLMVGNIGRNVPYMIGFDDTNIEQVPNNLHFAGNSGTLTTAVIRDQSPANTAGTAGNVITFEGNVFNQPIGVTGVTGITQANPGLVNDGTGIYRPTSTSINPGINNRIPAPLEPGLTISGVGSSFT